MARHNNVILYGQVAAPPRIFKNEDGEYLRGMCPITTIRGIRDFGNNSIDKLRYDCPVIMTSSPEQLKEMETWQRGDMVEIKGTIATKEIAKVTPCPHCGGKNKVSGNVVYVNPIYLSIREKGLSDLEGQELLKKRLEISNQVTVVGTLCREPESYTTPNGQTITQYQLAINRKFRVKEDAPEIRTDYPWVKSYGKIAEGDIKALRMDSVVLVDGMLQHRNIERTTTCCHCGTEYKWKDSAMEIVPYAVDYLQNFFTQEEIAAKESAEAEALADTILA